MREYSDEGLRELAAILRERYRAYQVAYHSSHDGNALGLDEWFETIRPGTMDEIKELMYDVYDYRRD